MGSLVLTLSFVPFFSGDVLPPPVFEKNAEYLKWGPKELEV
jgi:hypothetical protein